MIVNSLKDGWEIIYQRSHANLAAILVAAWRKKDHVSRWTELIIATAQHDDQEMFWSEITHLTEVGAPLDFTQGTLDTTRMQAELVIANAFRQGIWIALLISMHNSFLYEPLRGKDNQLDKFLDTQKDNQEKWRKSLGYSKQQIEEAYSFLRWADRLSLILCRKELPDRERELDIAPDKAGNMIRVMQRLDETLHVEPWIFEDDSLRVSVEVRKLKQLEFDNEETFQNALNKAEIETRIWHFKK